MHKQHGFVLGFLKQRSSFFTIMVLRYQKYSNPLRLTMVPYNNESQYLRIQQFITCQFNKDCIHKKRVMMIMMMNCFCEMVDRRKALSIISSRDHCQRFSPLQISDTPRAVVEPVQNLSSHFLEYSCAVAGPAKQISKQGRGPWNTEKYCRLPWLAGKKNFRILDALEWLKQ